MSIQWPLVLFSLLAGSGGAVLAYAGYGDMKDSSKKLQFQAGIIGLVMIVLGGICSVFHLGHPASFMAAVSHLGSFSGISVELMFAGALVICGVVYVISVKRNAKSVSKVFGIIDLVLGIVFAFMIGMSYLIPAQPAWNTVLLPLCFLFSCLSLGGFIYIVLNAHLSDDESNPMIVMSVLVCSATAAVLCLIYGFVSGGFDEGSALAFFLIATAGGVVAAIGAWYVKSKKNKEMWMWIGLAGSLCCALFIRMFMWAAATGWIDAFAEAVANRGLYLF